MIERQGDDMTKYFVIHNGYKLQDFRSKEEVDEYIKQSINKNVQCSLVENIKIDNALGDFSMAKIMSTRLVRFRYATLYEEVFIIEEHRY